MHHLRVISGPGMRLCNLDFFRPTAYDMKNQDAETLQNQTARLGNPVRAIVIHIEGATGSDHPTYTY
jgi:hypothetical protein